MRRKSHTQPKGAPKVKACEALFKVKKKKKNPVARKAGGWLYGGTSRPHGDGGDGRKRLHHRPTHTNVAPKIYQIVHLGPGKQKQQHSAAPTCQPLGIGSSALQNRFQRGGNWGDRLRRTPGRRNPKMCSVETTDQTRDRRR